MVQKMGVVPICLANQQVVKQSLREERIGPLHETYRSLTETLAKNENPVDHFLWGGKPQGTCFLCPEGSLL